MAGVVARELKQQSAFASGEQEILLGLLIENLVFGVIERRTVRRWGMQT